MSDLDTYSPNPNSYLQQAARAAHAELPDCGFILITMPFGDGSMKENVNVQYVSNVCREDAVKGLKTLLFHWGVNEEWMDKAK